MSCTGPWPSRVKQVVVRNMLRALGFRDDIVPNGQEALAAVQRGGYDWVLGCQQVGDERLRHQSGDPRLGGRDAPPQCSPIVALTANALVGDAEACRAVGMDDHLAKPCSRKQLGSVMARRLPATPVDRRSEPAPNAGLAFCLRS